MKDHALHHAGHGGSHHSMTADDATLFLRRFWWTTILLVPLLLTSQIGIKYIGFPDFIGREYVGFAISLIIFYFSLIFFEHASHEIKSRQFGMMTLVSVAVSAGFLFSTASTFLPYFEGMEFFLEISTLIWVLLFGHFLEAKSSATAGSALQEVAKLLPKEAHVLHGDEIHDMPLTELSVGMTVLIKPGEKVPADGKVVEGGAQLNESLITGESKPVSRKVGELVIAGSISIDGVLKVTIEKIGQDSTVGQIQKLVEHAHTTKPRLQQLADRVASWLTFVALAVSIVTVLVWTLIAGETFAFSLTLAVTVLVIACPHALGLAIPTVSTTATQLALKHGIFVKSLKKLEAAKSVNYVAFDKTGTLTLGQPAVVDVLAEREDELMAVAASLEFSSSHPIAKSILNYAKEKNIQIQKVTNFKNLSGLGVTARVGTIQYYLGSSQLLTSNGVELGKFDRDYQKLSAQGKTVIALADSKKTLGLMAIADKIRPESLKAIESLHEMGVKVAMITGDNEGVAKYVANELKIDTYFYQVLPEDKYKKIKELQSGGSSVLMVGDGVNDAPALIQANVGVAIGAGTDVAVEAGDIVLTQNNPEDIARIIILAKKVYSKMIQNLVWAVGYNVVAIPAAAGAFSKFGIFLRPEIGAFLMAISSVIVVVNALQLRRVRI